MAKQVVINYQGNDYTLEFNRKIAKRMEDAGFVIDTNHPITMITDLFRGAFQMHHRHITPELIEKIWDAQRKKDDLLTVLIGMYTDTITSLMEEPEDGEGENPTWKAL